MQLLDTKLSECDHAEECLKFKIASAKTFVGICFESESKAKMW